DGIEGSVRELECLPLAERQLSAVLDRDNGKAKVHQIAPPARQGRCGVDCRAHAAPFGGSPSLGWKAAKASRTSFEGCACRSRSAFRRRASAKLRTLRCSRVVVGSS